MSLTDFLKPIQTTGASLWMAGENARVDREAAERLRQGAERAAETAERARRAQIELEREENARRAAEARDMQTQRQAQGAAAAAARGPTPAQARAAEAASQQLAAAAAAKAQARSNCVRQCEITQGSLRMRGAPQSVVDSAGRSCIAKCPQGFADYGGEPGWMQSISNSTICNWFYTFYLANLVVFFLVIGAGAYAFFRSKRHVTPPHLFFALLQLIVAGTNMLFFYLICDRSLKPSL